MEKLQKGRKFTGNCIPVASELGKYLITNKKVVEACRKLHETGEEQIITI